MRSILPGRPQSSRQALSTVNWDGLRVVAYISGNTVIVFNGRREILQSIVVDDAEYLSALTIEEETGQIATSDRSTVYVYQPLGRDYGDLRWSRAHTFSTDNEPAIAYISWGSPSELLVAGQELALWNLAGDGNPQIIWSSDVSTPVAIACFSPDGGLIASFGQHDRIVKIWRRLSYEQDSTRFDVSYLSHPSAVISLSWRESWHQEQNLENLLYTSCADNQIRVWAHSDHHAYAALQKVATIDANISIQPRRLSMGSVSKSRTCFIIASRDIARAAERALQTYKGSTDHALEHLIEIANRSPEVCVFLDGLGHMSSWGVENAGLKNKLPAEKFNLALVDGVDIALPSNALDGFAQIHAFANNDMSASLCILVHQYSGQIDWYQGSFVEFFDTAARLHRIRHVSCWSGHDSVIDRMVAAPGAGSFLSLTEEDQAILWSHGEAKTLVRSSEAQSNSSILDAVLLDQHGFAVFLHSDAISLWDLRSMKSRLVYQQELNQGNPKSLQLTTHTSSTERGLLLLYESNKIEQYSIYLPEQMGSAKSNGYHKPLHLTGKLELASLQKKDLVELCTRSNYFLNRGSGFVLSWAQSGPVQIFKPSSGIGNGELKPMSHLATQIRTSNIGTCLGGKVLAIVHADYRTISIWSVTQGSCELVHTFNDLDWIQELYWHTTHGGLLVLAVQFAYNIAIISQQRYSLDGGTSAWEVQQMIPTRRHSSHVIGSLCWLESCQIAVGLGNQILTFDVAATGNEVEFSDFGLKPEVDDHANKHIRLQNSSLPLFSPHILGDLLRVGQYSAATRILESLYNELRFLTQDEAVLPDERPAVEKLINQTRHETSSDGDMKPSEQTSEIYFDLEDAQPQIDEKISKIASWQLPMSQQKHLRGLLGISIELMQEQKSLDSFALTYTHHFLRAIQQVDPTDPFLLPLPYSAIVHASLSTTQEALLHFIDAHLETHNIKFTWSTARSLGHFLWISDANTLRTSFESIARAEYNRNSEDRNPVDCSLYYLALSKKSILQSLWRRTVGVRERENTLKLLAHDFSEQRWKATALKNAYALLSKRRFEYAAAFFLLGGSLGDAVGVCVGNLKDLQLGIAVARVWGGDSEVQKKAMANLLDKIVLELAVDSDEARWMAIWACTHRDGWAEAISYIVKPVDVLFQTQFEARRVSESDEEKQRNMPFAAMGYRANEPTLLINLYKKLRSKLLQAGQWTEDIITPRQEWDFILRCVGWYERAGMDWLALQLVATWEFVAWQDVRSKAASTVKHAKVEAGGNGVDADLDQRSALDDWLMPEEAGVTQVVASRDVKSQNEGKDKHKEEEPKNKAKPPPTQFIEPSADSLLDSFGF